MNFYIDRHSGRSNGKFRNVYKTDDADEAYRRYIVLKTALRQGTVRLWDNGKIILSTGAPRLRTRW